MRLHVTTRRRLAGTALLLIVGGAVYWGASSRQRRDEASQDLVAAVVQGDMARVRELLGRRADPDRRQYPPRERALREWLYSLLSPGNRNRDMGTGLPMLLMALEHDRSDIAQLLIEHGANPNVSDELDQTALHWSIGHPDLVRLLLTKHARTDRADRQFQTALDMAIMGDDLESAALLLDAGASTAPPAPVPPPRLALTGPPLPEPLTPLARAVKLGRSRIVKLLLSHGAPLPPSAADQRDLVFDAIRSGDADTVGALLDHGIDVEIDNGDGQSPLLYAAGIGAEPQVIRVLLAHGARLDRRDHGYKMTPLGWAVSRKKTGAVVDNQPDWSSPELALLQARWGPRYNRESDVYEKAVREASGAAKIRVRDFSENVEILKRAGGK